MIFGAILNRFVKSILQDRGVHLFRNSAPRGFDTFTDLRRSGILDQIATYIDVGANDGDFAASAMSAIRNLKKAILIEPDETNYVKLAARFAGKAQVLKCAVSNYSGHGILRISPSDKMHSLLPKGIGTDSFNGSTDFVEVRTLAEIVRGSSVVAPYFIKTDTEGHDIAVIEGMGDISDKTICVFAEGTFSNDKSITPFQNLHDALTTKGFLFWGIYDQSPWGRCGSCNFVNGLFINKSFLE